MTAEVAEAGMLTGALDLLLDKSSIQKTSTAAASMKSSKTTQNTEGQQISERKEHCERLLAVDVMCSLGRRRARATRCHAFSASRVFRPRVGTLVFAPASCTSDWRSSVQVASPQRRRMTDKKLSFDEKQRNAMAVRSCA